jgi:hypothetical protein
MPLDPRIALGVQPMQLQMPDPNSGMNALARMMQIRGMQDEQQVNALTLQGKQRDIERRNKLDSLLGGFSGKPEELESSLLRGGFLDEAGKVGKDRRENLKLENESANAASQRAKADLEMALKKTEHVSSVLSMANPQNWQTVRQVIAQSYGQQLPEQFDPTFVQASVAQGQTLTQRLQAEHQRLTLAETVRHNKTGEGIQLGQLGETRRHNTTMEGYRGSEVGQGQTQVINDPVQGPMLVNKRTGAAQPVTMGGKPVAGEQQAKDKAGAQRTLPIIEEAERLIDQATGSYVGAGVDLAGRAVGQSTKGADAIAQLKVLEGRLMLAQPRMEGPQSNHDVQLYRQMAGQIGDPTVPPDMKKAALGAIKRLQQQYAGSPAATPTAPATPAAPVAAPRVPRISGDSEYNALPSGATFIGPDGKQRRKP